MNYAVNLGVTNVKRDAAEAPDGSANSSEDSGPAGSVNLQAELSSRSAIQALVLTEITDTSNVSQNTSPGNPNDVELVTDIIRNSIARLTYSRIDATLQTNIWGEFRKIKYSDNTSLNSLIQTVGAKLDFRGRF